MLHASDGPAPEWSRRDFLHRSCSLFVAATLAAHGVALGGCDAGGTSSETPGLTRTGSTLAVTLAAFPALTATGGSLFIADLDVLIVHPSGDDYRAFDAVCPHEGNQIRLFEPAGGTFRLRCPSHGWTFDLEGRPTGEAREGTTRLALTASATTLTVTLPS